jgi:hypothetical protein
VTVRLTSLAPKAPQAGDTLRLRGQVRNVTDHAISDVTASLRIGGQVHTRGRLAAYAEQRTAAGTPAPGQPLSDSRAPLNPSRLGPGDSAVFAVSVSVDSPAVHAVLTHGGADPATAAGVYRLAVEVRGEDSADPSPHRIGLLRTFLPWDPVGSADLPQPTPLAWLWPLTGRPHRAAGGTFSDNRLAQSLSSDGRLSKLVAVAADAAQLPRRPAKKARPAAGGKPAHDAVLGSRPVPVAWLVDPMLVDAAHAMTDGYRVRGQDGKHPEGAHAATDWLDRLADATRKATVVALPYADPDVVALNRHHVDAGRVLPRAADAAIVAKTLHVHPRRAVAAPPMGVAGSRVVDRLVKAKAQAVLLSSRTMPQLTDVRHTPGAHVRLTGRHRTVDGVLADARLTRIVGSGATDPPSHRLAEQRFLATTLLITGEAPHRRRPIVVAPPRDWNPTKRYAGALLTDSGTVPWLTPVTIDDVLASPASTAPRAGPRVPKDTRPLPASYLRPIPALRHQVAGLRAMLRSGEAGSAASTTTSSGPGPVVGGLTRAIDRTESVAWRGRLGPAAAARADVATAIAGERRNVRIASQGQYLLSSRNGTIPVSVRNDLSEPVTVVVDINPGPSATVETGNRRRITIGAGKTHTENVRLKARTSGVFPVMLSLHPPGHVRAIGKPVRIRVQSSSYGTIAIGITAGALALLLIAVVFRLTRRVLRREGASRGAEQRATVAGTQR